MDKLKVLVTVILGFSQLLNGYPALPQASHSKNISTQEGLNSLSGTQYTWPTTIPMTIHILHQTNNCATDNSNQENNNLSLNEENLKDLLQDGNAEVDQMLHRFGRNNPQEEESQSFQVISLVRVKRDIIGDNISETTVGTTVATTRKTFDDVKNSQRHIEIWDEEELENPEDDENYSYNTNKNQVDTTKTSDERIAEQKMEEENKSTITKLIAKFGKMIENSDNDQSIDDNSGEDALIKSLVSQLIDVVDHDNEGSSEFNGEHEEEKNNHSNIQKVEDKKEASQDKTETTKEEDHAISLLLTDKSTLSPKNPKLVKPQHKIQSNPFETPKQNKGTEHFPVNTTTPMGSSSQEPTPNPQMSKKPTEHPELVQHKKLLPKPTLKQSSLQKLTHSPQSLRNIALKIKNQNTLSEKPKMLMPKHLPFQKPTLNSPYPKNAKLKLKYPNNSTEKQKSIQHKAPLPKPIPKLALDPQKSKNITPKPHNNPSENPKAAYYKKQISKATSKRSSFQKPVSNITKIKPPKPNHLKVIKNTISSKYTLKSIPNKKLPTPKPKEHKQYAVLNKVIKTSTLVPKHARFGNRVPFRYPIL